jgi:hypothetical protein
VRDAVGAGFAPVLAEQSADAALVRRFGVGQFPSIVWTDGACDAVAVTVQPEAPEDALRDLQAARAFLREAGADAR